MRLHYRLKPYGHMSYPEQCAKSTKETVWDDLNVAPRPRYHTNVHYQPNLTGINCQANSTATFRDSARWQSSP